MTVSNRLLKIQHFRLPTQLNGELIEIFFQVGVAVRVFVIRTSVIQICDLDDFPATPPFRHPPKPFCAWKRLQLSIVSIPTKLIRRPIFFRGVTTW
ncbi:MAG: hypothetical protein QNL77_10945 [Akkermansiaceae bacterium]